MRYLDTNAFPNETLIESLNLKYDSKEIPDLPAVGDVILTDPFHAQDWAWLPAYVIVKIVPDNTDLERMDPFKWALKREWPKNNTYYKTPPSERSKNYPRYLEIKKWAMAHTYSKIKIDLGEAPFKYETVTDPELIPDILSRIENDYFGIDYEYDPNEVIIGIGLADRDMSWYVEGPALQRLLDLLPQLLKSEFKVAHAAKAEYRVTALNLGLRPTSYAPFLDTNVMSWILTSVVGGHDLKGLVERKLGREVLRFMDVAPDGDLTNTSPDLRARYAAADPRNTLDLFYVLKAELEEAKLWDVYYNIDRPVTPVLVEMEMEGITIDRGVLSEQLVKQTQTRWTHQENLKAMGFKGVPSAPAQIADWFYNDLELPVLETNQQGGSVAKPVLNRLRDMHPAVGEYIAYQESNKLLTTFLQPTYALNATKIPFSLQQTNTRTGRLSCTAYAPDLERNTTYKKEGTNMQNWPWEVRSIVVVDEDKQDTHHIAAADFSSEEPRIVAKASGEPGMLRDFELGQSPYINLGIDLGFPPERVRDKSGEGYKVAKTVFLAWLYGGSGFKMAEICARDGIKLTPQECDQYSVRLKESRPLLARWRDQVIRDCEREGGVRTLFGRRRLIPQIYSKDPSMRLEAERWAINLVPQGTGGDVIKKALTVVSKPLRAFSGRTFMTVHDEIDIIVPMGMDMREFMELMCSTGQEVGLDLEASINFGKDWREAHG